MRIPIPFPYTIREVLVGVMCIESCLVSLVCGDGSLCRGIRKVWRREMVVVVVVWMKILGLDKNWVEVRLEKDEGEKSMEII